MVKVALVAIAKNEGAYLPEWLAHHLHMGFDRIDVWVNGSDDRSFETLRQIQYNEPRLRTIVGDEFLERCVLHNKQFQLEAYNKTLAELRETDFTHMMCLDIDEFFVSASMRLTIKDVLENNQADVVAVPRHVDEATHDAEPFGCAVGSEMRRERYELVKSVVRISPRVKACDIHTFAVEDGRYILPSGMKFPARNASKNDALSREYMLANNTSPELAFILHRLHRSPLEYVSGLLRGRRHVRDVKHKLKNNRHGFANNRDRMVRFKVLHERYVAYRVDVDLMLYRWNVLDNVEHDQRLVRERAETVLEMAKSDPEVLKQYAHVFVGIDVDNITRRPDFGDMTHWHVDAVKVSDGTVTVFGWAFNKYQAFSYPAVSLKGEPVGFDLERVHRADVAEKHDLSSAMCGFKITLPDPGHGQLSKDDVSLTF